MAVLAQSARPEIVAPAGDAEKLFFAWHYGADAAYVGGGAFSLRAGCGFDLPQLREACSLRDKMGKKLYVALNIYANSDDLRTLPAYMEELAELRPDGLIVSDPGVFSLCRKYAPALPLHISTQANVTNSAAARFWAGQGAKRVVVAREVSLAQLGELVREGGLEIETFVHGAMCMSYSGRCLLSAFLTQRSANRGACSHPCRWNYRLEEEQRPGEFFPIEEDERGSYIFNSRDLCLLEQLPLLLESGAHAWKIEGRNKSACYVATIARVYAAARDALCAGDEFDFPAALAELQRISHRKYTTGFALGQVGAESFRYDDGGYIRSYDFAAVAQSCANGLLTLEQRNHFQPGDTLEMLLPDGGVRLIPVRQIFDEAGREVAAACHPRQIVSVPVEEQAIFHLPLICRRAVRAQK